MWRWWGQAGEQGGCLHSPCTRRPDRQEQLRESPRVWPNSSSAKTVHSSHLPHRAFGSFSTAQSTIQSSNNSWNRRVILSKLSTDKAHVSLASNRENNLWQRKELVICSLRLQAVPNVVPTYPETVTQPSLWHWTQPRDGGGIDQVTFPRSPGNPAAYLSPGPEIYWLWGHTYHPNAPGTNAPLIWGWHFIHSPPIY